MAEDNPFVPKTVAPYRYEWYRYQQAQQGRKKKRPRRKIGEPLIDIPITLGHPNRRT